jgi:hypothetical protein
MYIAYAQSTGGTILCLYTLSEKQDWLLDIVRYINS